MSQPALLSSCWCWCVLLRSVEASDYARDEKSSGLKWEQIIASAFGFVLVLGLCVCVPLRRCVRRGGFKRFLSCCRRGLRELEGGEQVLLASAAEDHEVCIWNTDQDFEGQIASMDDHDSTVHALAGIGHGLLASAGQDGTIFVWQQSSTITNLGSIDTFSPVHAISALGSGLLVTGSDTGSVSFWRLETGECLCTFETHSDRISSMVALDDGRIIVGSMDWTCSVYRASRHVGILQGHLGPVYAVAALSNGDVATGSADRSIRIWDLDNTSTAKRTFNAHRGPVLCIAAAGSTEGYPIFISGSADQTLRVWNADAVECLKLLQGHTAAIHSVVILDKTRIASGSGDGEIMIWNLEQQKHISSFKAHQGQQVHNLVCLSADKVAAFDAQAETHATSLLQLERVELAVAAELLQGGAPPEQGTFAELYRKAVEQASADLEICSKSLAAQQFHSEPNMILKSHPELRQGTGIVPHCPFSAADVALAGSSKQGTAELWFLAGPAGLGGPAMLKAAVGVELWTCVESAVTARLRWACQRRQAPALRYSILLCKHLSCTHVPEYTEARVALGEIAHLPATWDVAGPILDQHRRRGSSKGLVPNSSSVWAGMQELLDQTFDHIRTQDREGRIPSRLLLRRLFWVQNEPTWVKYHRRRETTWKELVQGQEPCRDKELRETLQSVGVQLFEHNSEEITLSDVRTASASGFLPMLEDQCRERWLWHGTTSTAAEKIAEQGFSMDLAGSGAGTLYGHGIYFSECSSKADEYAGQGTSQECVMLLCRAVLGRILYTAEDRPDVSQLVEQCRVGPYHSVLGDRKVARGTYREVVVYNSHQVYPEFLVYYERQFQERKSGRRNSK